MNQTSNNSSLELARLSRSILEAAQDDIFGISWKTMALQNRIISWNTSESLYSGTAGIALFLLNYYRHSGNQESIEAVRNAAKWIEHHCKELDSDYYAFFTGRMGIPYFLLELHKEIRDESLLHSAISIAKKSKVMLASNQHVCDLINGFSGTLLGLLHVYHATRSDDIEDLADRFAEKLIEECWVAEHGVYWDRSEQTIRGLCGFSHGAAGIGFVFLELGRYFQNEAFYWLAREAFRYENCYFNAQWNNWPDFRKGIWFEKDAEEFEKAYKSNNIDFFTTPRDFSAWCHGAAGIGLSRLHAWKVLGDKEYFHDYENAVKKVRSVDLVSRPQRSFTLCHGSGGNADLLIEAYRLTGNESYLQDAYRISELALQSRQEIGKYISGFADAGKEEDLSLFMGNAGIGYFYLRLLNPEIKSILMPVVESNGVKPNPKYKTLNISLSQLQKRMCAKIYRRTTFFIEQSLPEFFKENSSLNSCLQDIEKFSVQNTDSRLDEVFKIEKTARELNLAVESFALLEAENQYRPKNYDGDTKLKLSPRVRLLTTNSNESSEKFIVLYVTIEGVKETLVEQFTGLVLSAFSEPCSSKAALTKIFDMIESENHHELKQIVIQQINDAFLAGILIIADTHF
ncbi:hypothetical protein K1X84_01000 [bacterium]|nr:hypothetical protein [bacterium]